MTLTTVRQLFLLYLLWLCGTWSPTGGRTMCFIQRTYKTREQQRDDNDDNDDLTFEYFFSGLNQD